MKKNLFPFIVGMTGCLTMATVALGNMSSNEMSDSQATEQSSEQPTEQQAGTVSEEQTPDSSQQAGKTGKKSQDMNMSAKTPSEVCQRLVQALQNDDFEMAKRWTTSTMHKDQQAGQAAGKSGSTTSKQGTSKVEQKFHEMTSEHMSALKNASCGKEMATNDHAVVEVRTKSETRLIPFVKMNDQWKFDFDAYRSFYRDVQSGTGSTS